MIKLPERPALTLAKAFELLRELDYWAGIKSASNVAAGPVDRTRAALADHVARSLARKERGRK